LLGACGSTAASGPTTVPGGTLGGIGTLPDNGPEPIQTVPEPSSTTLAESTTTPSTTTAPRVTPASQGAAGAFILDPGDSPVIDDARVLMIGDSVLEATTFNDPDDLDRYVATLGWQIWVDAERGRHMAQAESLLKTILTDDPPWQPPVVPQSVVLMLGNNYDETREDFVDALRGVLDELRAARRIVMFTVPLYKPNQADVNEELRAAAARDPRIILVDWERFSREWQGVLRSDGLHPNERGSSLLAQLIGLALGPAPGLDHPVDLPTLGTLNDDPLPDWTPPKVRESVEPVVTTPVTTVARPPTSRGSTTTSTTSTSPPTDPPTTG
jgi:hypothetical protein